MRWTLFALVLTAAGRTQGVCQEAAVPQWRSAPGHISEPRQRKMLAPLEVTLTPLPARKGDGEGDRRLRVSVRPKVAAPRLEVTVTLPPAVTLAEGERRWQAPAVARVAQTRDLLLRVPRTGEQRVVVTVRLLFQKSLPMAAAASYSFGEGAVAARRSAEPEDLLVIP